MIPVLLGLLALGFVFVVTQERFYSAYGRKYSRLRPLRQRAMGPNPQEFREMLRASFRRDPDSAVERARRVYLAAFAIMLAYGLWAVLSGALYGG